MTKVCLTEYCVKSTQQGISQNVLERKSCEGGAGREKQGLQKSAQQIIVSRVHIREEISQMRINILFPN